MKILRLVFFFLLAIFPLGQLDRLTFGNGEIALHLNDLVAGCLIGGWLIWHLYKRQKIEFPPLAKPIMAFSLLALFSLLISFPFLGVSLAAGFYLLRWITYAGLYFFLYEAFLGGVILKGKTLRVLTLMGVIVGMLGIFQYFFYPDLRNLYYLGWDPHYFRVFSTFLDPAFTGLILVLTLILIISYIFQSGWKQERLKWWIILSITSTYIGFSLTYARSAFGAFLSAIFILAYLKKSLKFFLIALLIFILTLFILPKQEDRIGSDLTREESSFARIVSWKHSLQIIKDHPLFGVGFNNYRQDQEKYGFLKNDEATSHAGAGADSSLLFVWATTGIFGFVTYLWLGWKIINLGLTSWRNKKLIYGLVLLASCGALFFHSFFVNSLFYPWIMEWIWILAACVSVDESLTRESK